ESLLPATAEDERIAALEANDRLARSRTFDDQGLRLLLRDRCSPALLAHEQELGIAPRAVEGARRDQPVMEDHVGARDQLERPRRQQAGVAGAGPDEVHAPAHVAAAICSARASSSAAPASPSRAATSRPSASGSS